MFYGLPHGTFLGPLAFKLFVAELAGSMSSISMQCVDDTTISYCYCLKWEPYICINKIERDVDQLPSWS